MLEKNMPYYKELKNNYGVKIGIVNTINKENCKDIFYNYTNIYEYTGMPIGYLFVHEDDWELEDFEVIKEQLCELRDYCDDKKVGMQICNIYNRGNSGLSNGEGFEGICSACISSFTVNYEGNIYPCHRSYFNNLGSAYVIGHVDTGISLAKKALMYEMNNMDKLPEKCRKCNPAIRHRCHICIATNKKVYKDPHFVPNSYCLLQKEIHYLLLDKAMKNAPSTKVSAQA